MWMDCPCLIIRGLYDYHLVWVFLRTLSCPFGYTHPVGWAYLIHIPNLRFVESDSGIKSFNVGVWSSYQLSHDFWCVLGWWGQRYLLGFQLFLTFQAFAEIALLLPVVILDRQVEHRAWRNIFSYSTISPSKPDVIKSSLINESFCLWGRRSVVPSSRVRFLSLINFQEWEIQYGVVKWERYGKILSNSLTTFWIW